MANPILHHAFHTWTPPLLGEPKSIEIGFGSHSVTILKLPKHEDRYATYNNETGYLWNDTCTEQSDTPKEYQF